MNIDLIIKSHRLSIDSQYESIAQLFCNTEGAKSSITKERFVLNNWYEGYLYTVLVGLKVGRDRKGNQTDKATMWSDNYLKQYKYIILNVLSKQDVLQELGLLDYKKVLDIFKESGNSNDGIKNILSSVKKICDEYSAGGLKYLKDEYQKNNSIFNGHESLKDIYLNLK